MRLFFLITLSSLTLTLAHSHEGPGLHTHSHVRRQLAGGGEGGPSDGPSSSPEAAGYNCDPSKCQLPNCLCASTSPPGGLAPADTPQFITFTADDAIQIYTTRAVNSFLAQRRNPNGCPPKMTYFTSLTYCNYSMVTDWYVAGNEIADHTMTHVGDPSAAEINGNLAALNAFSGIPLSSIRGFRAPFLNYSRDTFTRLQAAGFTYDSSATSASPANATGTDAFWPYTLDNGLANDCLSVPNICKGQPQIPGFWEIPMYALTPSGGGIHLMDPWLDDPDPNKVEGWLREGFLSHYNGNRQPFGLYTHPIHLATGYPGVADPTARIAMINRFLDWAQTQPNVWIVSNEQLLAWMRDPKPVSQLDQVSALRCPVPNVSQNICNGMMPNQAGLLQNCPFQDFPWTTCYGCPVTPPSPTNPLPAQASPSQGQALRQRLPANCSTAFWDPIGGQCLCQSSGCAFTDETRAIGPNGANLTGGGTGNEQGNGGNGGGVTNRFMPFTGEAEKLVVTAATVLTGLVAGVAALVM